MIRFLKARFHRRYFGQYVHARKLFFFDSALVASIFILGALIVIFRLHDPHIILLDIGHFQKILGVPVSDLTANNLATPSAIPHIVLAASVGETRTIPPGDTIPLKITVLNDDLQPLHDIVITIPLPSSIIDLPRLFATSRGVLQDEILLFTAKEHAGLASLLPGEEFSMTVAIPITLTPSTEDTNLTITFTPRVRGRIASEPVETRAETEAVSIGTTLAAQAWLRYYTDDGNQLGHGPLPPVVNKETKYGLVISTENTTSRVAPFIISGTLSPKATWTGKISVNHGLGVLFNPETRQFHFAIPYLDPHDTVHIFIELGFLPDSTDIGATPILVEEIRVDGRDVFINRAIGKRLPPLDTTLPNDIIARSFDKTVHNE